MTGVREASPVLWWAALGTVLLALALPVFLVQIPPLTDYPNHLARMFVLAHPDDPELRQMYAARWAVLPNVAVDLIVPALMRVLPVHAAGKLVVLLCLLLPATGAVAYSRALFGVRSYWQLLVGLVAYNGLFLMGFLNFEIAVGAALWIAAGWTRFRGERPAATMVGAGLGATLVFFFHIFGVLFLGLLLGSHEAASAWRERRRRGGIAALRRRILPLAAVFALPAALYLLSPLSGVAGKIAWQGLPDKAVTAFVPFLNYVSRLDLLTGFAVFGMAGFAIVGRRGRAPLGTLLCLAALATLFVACPSEAKQGFYVDARFPVMAGFVVFAGLLPAFASRRAERAALALLAVLLAVRLAVVGAAWAGSVHDVAALRAVIAPVQPGERVLAVDVTVHDNQEHARRAPLWRYVTQLTATYRLLGALVLLERKAFWDAEFAIPSQQPWQVQPAYRDASCPSGAVPSYTALEAEVLPALVLELAPCVVGWRDKFDYVLVENAGGLPDPAGLLPDDLALLGHNDMAALYRVRRNERGR